MGYCGTSATSVKQRDIVAAALPVQDHWLPMSNLDLFLPPIDVGVFFCYKKCLPHDESVNILKKSLAQALAVFYPFAGEVVQNSLGEPEVLCNNRGVDFIHAYADMELKSIDLYNPDDSVEGTLVPLKKQGVLTVQVNIIRRGDRAEVWRCSMLNPRHPPVMNPIYDTLLVPISSLPQPQSQLPANPLISRIYYVEAKDINHLQSNSSFNGNPKRSKLVSFIAFLWKIIAECDDGHDTCKMGVVVDGRERLDNKINLHKLSLSDTKSFSMQNYFGNVLSIPYGEANSSALKEMPLSLVADMVHEFVSPALSEDHFRGFIDWIYTKMKETDAEAVVVSSGQRFPVESINFGWGKPVFGSYHFPWGGQTGYVMPMPNVRKNGDWIVYMHLFQKHLDLVETKGSKVSKPLTPSYLDF
ncbi:shikimate O-hydroxycinnamoyltransferase-like protein [Tanacetum coccineum]